MMYLHAAEGGHGLALVLLVLCGGVLVGAVGGGFWARRKRRGAAAMLAPRVTADIAPCILTPTVTVSSKTYDGTHAATITGCTLGGAIGGDVVGCSTAEATATFTAADAGDGIRVEVTGLALTGWDAGNYVLASTAVTTTADIAPCILTPTVTMTPDPTPSRDSAPRSTSTDFDTTLVASSPSQMSMDLHVVIVAFHAAEQLEVCLGALEQTAPVTVIDNSSSDAVRAVAAHHNATYFDPGGNLGFAAGVNVALRQIAERGPFDVLLLNPDAVLRPRELWQLREALHRPVDNRVAAIAPRLVDVDGQPQRVVWPFPTPSRAWLEASGLGRLPSSKHFVIGAVLLMRAEALRDIGLLDERFFLYAAETDWQRRADALGWTSDVCDDVVATHIGAGASLDPMLRESLFHTAHEKYIRKWFGTTGWESYRAASVIGSVARAIVLRGPRRSEAARRAGMYLHGPQRRAALRD